MNTFADHIFRTGTNYEVAAFLDGAGLHDLATDLRIAHDAAVHAKAKYEQMERREPSVEDIAANPFVQFFGGTPVDPVAEQKAWLTMCETAATVRDIKRAAINAVQKVHAD